MILVSQSCSKLRAGCNPEKGNFDFLYGTIRDYLLTHFLPFIWIKQCYTLKLKLYMKISKINKMFFILSPKCLKYIKRIQYLSFSEK